MIFMQCLLQIKPKIYSIDMFRAPVVTQLMVKVKKNRKVPFFKVLNCHFSISQHFPNVKVTVVQAVIA